MAAMKVLLVDDHALFRDGVALLLKPLRQGIEILVAGTCEQAAQCLLQNQQSPASPGRLVDLMLVDLGMPGMCGIEGLNWLRGQFPEIPMVVMSSSDDRDTVLRALDAGAMGFIPKSSTSSVMRAALELVLSGGLYLPPSVLIGVHGARRPPEAPAVAQAEEAWRQIKPATLDARESLEAVTTSDELSPLPDANDATAESLGLTARQAEVLNLILQGLPAKLICRELNLAPGTVKTHTSAVLRALKVTNRTQAVVAASRLGWRLRSA